MILSLLFLLKSKIYSLSLLDKNNKFVLSSLISILFGKLKGWINIFKGLFKSYEEVVDIDII